MYPDTLNRPYSISFISLHLLVCCTWSNEVFLLNVVLKSFSAVPEEADLFTMFRITVANGDETLKIDQILFFIL